MATTGQRGEGLVCRRLMMRGWTILARNWRIPGGEIDIVARRFDVVRFVEVKTRSPGSDTGEVVHPRQLMRIHRAAHQFVAASPGLSRNQVRIDVAVVSGRGLRRRVQWFGPICDDDLAAQ